jgi:hypothetical protein
MGGFPDQAEDAKYQQNKRARRLLSEPSSKRWDGIRHTLVPGYGHLALIRGGKLPAPRRHSRKQVLIAVS